MQVPETVNDASEGGAIRQLASQHLAPAEWVYGSTGDIVTKPALDSTLLLLWIASSVSMALLFMGSALVLARSKRRWVPTRIDGTAVYVAPDAGPAVVGWVHPEIVVPSWLVAAPRAQRAAVLAHERSHCDAGDPRLLILAFSLLVLMLWNLPLWWQVARLRRAIEVDCDARVLSVGHDARLYGETLLMVGQRQSGLLGIATAMSESTSFLETRINIMVSKPVRAWRLAAVLLGSLCVGLVSVAAQVSPPIKAADGSSGKGTGGALDGYAGYYRYADNAVVVVKRAGSNLTALFPGRDVDVLEAQGATRFRFAAVDAQLEFIVDAQGKTQSAVLHQNGAQTPMPRIDEVQANTIRAAASDRAQQQVASPGSEQALGRLIAGIIVGKVNFDEMNPQLAGALRNDLARFKVGIARLGPVKSMKLVRVEGGGLDVFEVQHEHGSAEWGIGVDSKGIITGAAVPDELGQSAGP